MSVLHLRWSLPFSLVLLAGPGRFAEGAELLRGPYDNPSPIAFEAQLGVAFGLGGYTPGGFNLGFDYTHRFAHYRDGKYGLWFFGDLAFLINGSAGGICLASNGSSYECSGVGYGSGLMAKAGLQLTIRTPIPLVPFVRAGAALTGAFGRDVCDDGGAGFPVFVVGGGARYHFTQHWSAGLSSELAVGPMYYGSGKCFAQSHTEAWRSLSLLAGAQYTL